MQFAQTIMNKPIYSIKEGKEVGKVHDLYLDRDLQAVTGVYLGKEGLLSREESMIKWANIVTAGSDVLLVDTVDAILKGDQQIDQLDEYEQYIRCEAIIGRPIDTPGGTKIGRIGDVILDEEAAVIGFGLAQVYVSGPILNNRVVSRSAMIDAGNEDQTMTVKLAAAEEADLKIVYKGFFAEPTVKPVAEEAV